MKNKKIMFAIGSLARGGAEKVVSLLASTCAEKGLNVSIVLLDNVERYYKVSDKVKICQVTASGKKSKELAYIQEVRHFIKEEDPDVIVPFLPLTVLCVIAANFLLGKKLVFSERGDPRIKLSETRAKGKHKIAHILVRKLGFFKLGNHMVFQTPDAQTYYGKKAYKKGTVIPNPLDDSALPERFEGERKKKIIAAGRFSEEKNFPMLLRSFARFRKEFPEYTLELYGEGGLRGQLEALCKELNVEDSVLMPGFVSDLADRMVNAAMYVSTSNHEGISNSMLEALGMGVPTIVTDCPVGGAKMFVKTDKNGVLIDMEDEDELYNAMVKIASNKEYAEKISKNAVKIREELSAEKITEKWTEVFEKVCSK